MSGNVFTGRQLHTVDYRNAAEFAGQRVVVAGGGRVRRSPRT
jgi:putative flavoprotein involved in K+ transport